MIAIRFAGSGGQGVQLAGIVLAEAAINHGKYAACTQTYGPESRGGASRADVIVSESEIDFPTARRLDVLIALSAEGYRRNAAVLRAGGLLICDRSLAADACAEVTVCALPIMDAAQEAGSAQSANVVALAAACASMRVIGREALEAALSARLRHAQASNQRALDAGWRLGERVALAVDAVGAPA